MVLIPTGSLNIGNNDEDITWAMSATSKTVSIQAFWMDETEITNDEYRQFVGWVLDSIRRQRLADEGHDEFLVKSRKLVMSFVGKRCRRNPSRYHPTFLLQQPE